MGGDLVPLTMAATYYVGGDSLMADVLRFGDADDRPCGISTARLGRRIIAIPHKE